MCLCNVTPYFVPAVHRLLVQYDIKILYSESGEECEEKERKNKNKKTGERGDNHLVLGVGLVHYTSICQPPLCL